MIKDCTALRHSYENGNGARGEFATDTHFLVKNTRRIHGDSERDVGHDVVFSPTWLSRTQGF